MTPRAAIHAAVKTVEPDAKRALEIAGHLAAEFRRHPQAEGRYLYPLAGPPRLLPENVVETMISGCLAIRIRSSKTLLRVVAERIEPRPDAFEAARYRADIGWWLPD